MGKIILATHRFKKPHQLNDVDWFKLAKAAHLMNKRITLALAILHEAQEENARERSSKSPKPLHLTPIGD